MGCLFGYCGRPEPGLLERMAEILQHRCACGWEHADLLSDANHITEIGHGIPPWCTESRVAQIADRRIALGYSGILFNAEIHLKGREKQQRLLNELDTDPDRVLASFDGVFAGALALQRTLRLIRDPAGIKACIGRATKTGWFLPAKSRRSLPTPPSPGRFGWTRYRNI